MDLTLPQATFVIAIVENDKIKSFYAFDSQSGYPYFSDSLFGIKFFSSKEKAIEVVEDLHKQSITPQKPHSGGTLYPASDVHRALDLSNKKKSGEATVVALELKLDHVFDRHIRGEIKEPTGYTYD